MASYVYHYRSPLGGITMASDGHCLAGLWFDGQQHFATTLDEHPQEARLPIFADTVRWLDIYFNGIAPDFMPPLVMNGTPFRMEVWDILRAIPYGQTITYGDIARQIACRRSMGRMSAQAVGGAVGSNPISIIVPCHRVVGAGGRLTGYAGGLERKQWLLAHEQLLSQSSNGI